MKLNKRKCKNCGIEFQKLTPLHSLCSPKCAIAHSKTLEVKRERTEARISREERRERLLAVKPLTKYAHEAQFYVNKYVRLRDKNLGCISCNKPASWSGQWHASHYKSVGANSALRFNLYNINKSCSVCNNYLSGAIGEYRNGLIEKYGIEKLEWLDNYEKSRKYKKEYLVKLKKVFMKMCKRLEKRNDYAN